jgi:formylglycine-generating enzyme required for sulfatase activity
MGASAAKAEIQIAGRYMLLGEIASGGMATVHFGRLLGAVGFSRPVAIKRLHPQLAKDPRVRAMFIDEARLVSRVRHPNVVPTLDVVSSDGELLLVMEYIHGESLARLGRITRQAGAPIPIPIVLAVVSNLLHGLHAAHEAKSEAGEPLQIVHRDVSPQNVLVGADGIARVLDFGIARATERLECTREGVIKGKLTYMPPEQLAGSTVTRAADIYATGVMLWEMLAGRRLFLRDDDGERVQLEKILRGVNEPPSAHDPMVSPALDEITLTALARNPGERFATAREMARAIEKAREIATPTEVSEWVEQTAAESLAKRTTQLEALERTSSKMRAATPSSLDVDILLGGAPKPIDPLDPQLKSSTFPLLDPNLESLAPSNASIPARASSELPSIVSKLPRARSLALAIAGVGALAFFGTSLLLSNSHGERAVRPVDTAGAAMLASMAPIEPCPEGMIEIPGGRFFMGSDDGLPLEKPAHNVTLSRYCIDKLEVSTESYKACSDRGDCKRAGIANDWDGISDRERRIFDPLCNVREPIGRGKHPINCVSWEMAAQYCKASGKRLPTEAEWEFAARGPDGRKYPWGDEEPGPTLLNACGRECMAWSAKNGVDQRAMFNADDGWATTSPVGSFPSGASRYGVQDVVGNVWEWVLDYYAEYSASDQVDPHGPGAGDERVIRGGAWNGGYASWVRPTFRYKDVGSKRSYGIGFRCAQSI